MSLWSPVQEIGLDSSISAPALDRKGEGVTPGGDLLLEVVDLGDLSASDLDLEVLELVGLLGKGALDFLADLDALINVGGDTLKVGSAKATAGHGWGAYADAARSQGALVAGDAVLVASNVHLLQDSLNAGAIQRVGAQVDQNHVRVRAVRDKLVSQSLELVLEGLGVVHHLLLVCLELGCGCLLERDGQRGDGVVVRAALVAGEDGEVDGLLQVVHDFFALGIHRADALAEEDHGTTGPAERLVRGSGDHIGIVEGRRDDTRRDETRDVSDIDDEVGTNRVGNLAHALIIDQAAVSRRAGDQDLRTVKYSVLGQLVVVDDAGLKVYPVRHGLEVGGHGRNPDERTARSAR